MMAASTPSLCQHEHCDAFQFTICRHCQLFLCIRHLAEHQQQFPSDFQRLLDDARRQQAQLSSFDTRLIDQRPRPNPSVDNDGTHCRSMHAYVQAKSSPALQSSMGMPSNPFADMRSCLTRLQQTNAFLPAMDKIGHMINDPVITINGKDVQFDEDSLFASLDPTAACIDSSDMINRFSRFPVANVKQDQSKAKSIGSGDQQSASLDCVSYSAQQSFLTSTYHRE